MPIATLRPLRTTWSMRMLPCLSVAEGARVSAITTFAPLGSVDGSLSGPLFPPLPVHPLSARTRTIALAANALPVWADLPVRADLSVRCDQRLRLTLVTVVALLKSGALPTEDSSGMDRSASAHGSRAADRGPKCVSRSQLPGRSTAGHRPKG